MSNVIHFIGPIGYPLCRHLRERGYICEVVAPSLIPKKGQRPPEDQSADSGQIARLFRAGELTGIDVPDAVDEAVRDLVECREARIEQLKARQRLKGFCCGTGVVMPASRAGRRRTGVTWPRSPCPLRRSGKLRESFFICQILYIIWRVPV
jgi:transposase